MPIPTVPGSDIEVSTPSQGAKLDAGALTAPARATLSAIDSRFRGVRAVAGGLEDVGGALGALASDMDKVHRAKIAADSDFRMRAAQQSFTESLKGDQNEHEWPERAQQTYEQVREEIYANHVIPPGMKPELDASIRNWGQTLQIKAQTLAQVQSVNQAELAIRKSYDEAGRDGDAQGMANAVKLGRTSKLDPVAMDEMEQNIPRALALTAIENGLRANPQGTHDLLASGGSLPVLDQNGRAIVPAKVFPQKELQSLVNAARTQSAAWQRANGEELLQTAADPITGMVPDEVIKGKMASKEISESFGRSLIASQDRKVKAQTSEEARAAAKADRDAYNLVTSRAHDPTAWGVNPDEYARSLVDDAAEISDPALRQRAINDANHQLAAVKKTGQLAERPVVTQMMALIREDRASQQAMVPLAVTDIPGAPAQRNIFVKDKPAVAATTTYQGIPGGIAAVRKMTDLEIEDKFGKGTTKDQVIYAINVHSARIENDMREWFKTPEGEKATFEQANAHRMDLERPYVMDSVRQQISRKAPAVITTKEEFDLLPQNAPFIFNGRAGVKN